MRGTEGTAPSHLHHHPALSTSPESWHLLKGVQQISPALVGKNFTFGFHDNGMLRQFQSYIGMWVAVFLHQDTFIAVDVVTVAIKQAFSYPLVLSYREEERGRERDVKVTERTKEGWSRSTLHDWGPHYDTGTSATTSILTSDISWRSFGILWVWITTPLYCAVLPVCFPKLS